MGDQTVRLAFWTDSIRAGSMHLSLIFLTFFTLAVTSLPMEAETLGVVNNDLKDGNEAIIAENANQLVSDDSSQLVEGSGSLPHSLKRRSPSPYIPRSWLRGGGSRGGRYSSSCSSCGGGGGYKRGGGGRGWGRTGGGRSSSLIISIARPRYSSYKSSCSVCG